MDEQTDRLPHCTPHLQCLPQHTWHQTDGWTDRQMDGWGGGRQADRHWLVGLRLGLYGRAVEIIHNLCGQELADAIHQTDLQSHQFLGVSESNCKKKHNWNVVSVLCHATSTTWLLCKTHIDNKIIPDPTVFLLRDTCKSCDFWTGNAISVVILVMVTHLFCTVFHAQHFLLTVPNFQHNLK